MWLSHYQGCQGEYQSTILLLFYQRSTFWILSDKVVIFENFLLKAVLFQYILLKAVTVLKFNAQEITFLISYLFPHEKETISG